MKLWVQTPAPYTGWMNVSGNCGIGGKSGIGRKKEIADNKNPEQLPGRDQLVYNKRVRPTKTEPQQGISYLETVREWGGWVGIGGGGRFRGGWL